MVQTEFHKYNSLNVSLTCFKDNLFLANPKNFCLFTFNSRSGFHLIFPILDQY